MRLNSTAIWRAIAIGAGLALIGLTIALYQGRSLSLGSPTGTRSAINENEPIPDTVRGKPSASIRSLWLENEEKQYVGLLEGKTCDTLVVPLQSQHFGFDRATRSLMSAQLALALAQQTGRCVVDPYLASDALGDGMRRLETEAIRELAASVKATTVVIVYVGHDGERNMEVFARIEKPRGTTSSLYGLSVQERWDGLAFTDEHPPFLVWREKLPEILAALDLGQSDVPTQATAGSETFDLPDAPEQLVTLPVRSPLDDARRYELLAALGPEPSFRATERLYEKAWLAATVAGDTPASRRVRARALMHLGYRPAAIATLGKDETPVGQALRALLDGNLPEAEEAAKNIDSAADALIAAVELRDLRFRYGHGQAGEPMSQPILAAQQLSKSWNTLLGARGGQYDGWQIDDNLALKDLLDSLYPIEGYSVDEILRARSVAGNDQDQRDFQLLTKRHFDRLLAHQPQRFCCSSFKLHPSELDFLQLVSARSMFNLERRINHQMWMQGNFEGAMRWLDVLDAEYPGHPHFASLRANALLRLATSNRNPREAEYVQRAHTEARKADYYEQSGTPYTLIARVSYGILPPGTEPFIGNYRRDYPPNPQSARGLEALRFASAFPGTDNLGNVNADQLDEVLAVLKTRFHGSREALNYVAQMELRAPGGPDPEALRAQIERDPGNWESYERLVGVLIKSGDADGVVKLVERYPGFAPDSGENAVGLSNHAGEIGSLLYWTGHLDAARKFYALAAGYGTGSDASLLGAQRVAILDGDFATAAGYAQKRALRYRQDYATRDFLMYLFALGYPDQGWPGFMAAAERATISEFWIAALVGKRIEGASDASVAEWLTSDSVRSIDAAGEAPALGLGLLYFMMDRAPTEGLSETLARIEGKPVNRIDVNSIERPTRDGTAFTMIERGKFAKDWQAGKLGDLVPSPDVLFATAYEALRAGDYATAAKGFERYSSYYAIEGDRWYPSMAAALPYAAFVAAKTGDTRHLEAYLEGLSEAEKHSDATAVFGTIENRKFQRHLAMAYFAGLAGNVDRGLKELKNALIGMPLGAGTNAINAYQYAETCIWLYDETQDERYRELALTWARTYQRMEPIMGWAYSLEAAYGDSKDKRHTRAIALAWYLDRNSFWLRKVPKAEVEKARAWLPQNNPFLKVGREKVRAI